MKGFDPKELSLSGGIWDVIRKLMKIPHIEFGVINGVGWVKVTFSSPFVEPPSVIAVTTPYSIDNPVVYQIPKVSFPKISVPRVTMPRAPKLPEWQRDDYRKTAAERLKKAFQDAAGDWGPLNWLRDKFADIFYAIGYAVGFLFNLFWDLFIKPYADKWNDKIQEINNALAEATEDAENAVRSMLEESVNNINSAASYMQDVINNYVIANLNQIATWAQYVLNRFSEMGATAAPVRNVTRYGFEVYVPEGSSVYVIAVGY